LNVKRRFDDVYRVLLVIGPIMSFAFSNYALAAAQNFVYNIGYSFLIASVFLWAIPHLVAKKWEYSIKLIGLVLAWFASFGLFFIVYLKESSGILALVIDIAATLVITYIAGRDLKNAQVISPRTAKLTIIFAVLVGLLAVLLIS
jgi:hypothetical protein